MGDKRNKLDINEQQREGEMSMKHRTSSYKGMHLHTKSEMKKV